MQNKNTKSIRLISGIAVFSALAYVVAAVCQVIPQVAGFLTLDMKDAVISMASLIYGPVAGPIIALIAALLEFATFSSTGWYGLIMNFVSSAVFSLVASLIYKLLKSFEGALLAFLLAIMTTTGAMLLMNIFVTPLYMKYMLGIPNPDVISMLPTVLLPFNFAKTFLNASLALMLYKPLISALRSARLVPAGSHKAGKGNLLLTVIIGIISMLIAISVVIFI